MNYPDCHTVQAGGCLRLMLFIDLNKPSYKISLEFNLNHNMRSKI